MKRLISFIIALVVLVVPCTAEQGRMAFTHTVNGNTLTVMGVHPNGEGNDATFLVTTDQFDGSTVEGIVYIDQKTVGVNGSFIFNVGLGEINEFVTIKTGGTDIHEPASVRTFLSTPKATLDAITDDSVIIGRDVYDLKSSHLTVQNIGESMKRGGNTMAYKWGGLWYDLMNPMADSSAFLVPKNALSDAEIRSWQLDMWYLQGLSYPLLF